jgi:hypothetical protein
MYAAQPGEQRRRGVPPRRSDRELLRGAVGTPGPTFAKEAVREAFSPKTICRRVDLQVISLTRSLP